LTLKLLGFLKWSNCSDDATGKRQAASTIEVMIVLLSFDYSVLL
jgi:hypothetical protein